MKEQKKSKVSYLNKSEKLNVGICHPGAVDKTTGLIKNAHNSQWLNNKNLINHYTN